MDLFNKKYELIQQLAKSSTKTVWKARDTIQDRFVALKIYHSNQKKYNLDTLVRNEAAALTRVGHHQNITEIYDANSDQTDQFFIAEEYAEGETLAKWISHTHMDAQAIRRLRNIVRDVLRGVYHIHRAGLVHGDLKLENIILTRTGAKITDFGSSVLKGKNVSTGSLRYHSPELIKDGTRIPASDIWQIGILMYRAVTGRFPFGIPEEIWERVPNDRKGEYRDLVHRQIVEKQVINPQFYNPFISLRMRNVILACLEKDPAKRPTATKARWMLRPSWMYEAIGFGLVGGIALGLALLSPYKCLMRQPTDIIFKTHEQGMTRWYRMDSAGVDRSRLLTKAKRVAVNNARTSITYSRANGSLDEVIQLNSNTGYEKVLLSAPNTNLLVWSPDDRRIAVTAMEDGIPMIYVTGERTERWKSPLAEELAWHPSGAYLSVLNSGTLFFADEKGIRSLEGLPKNIASHCWTNQGLVVALAGAGPDGKVVLYEKFTRDLVVPEPKKLYIFAATRVRPLRSGDGVWLLSYGLLHILPFGKPSTTIGVGEMQPGVSQCIVDAMEGASQREWYIITRENDIDGSGFLDKNDQIIQRVLISEDGKRIVRTPYKPSSVDELLVLPR